jgi:hypothetical protein
VSGFGDFIIDYWFCVGCCPGSSFSLSLSFESIIESLSPYYSVFCHLPAYARAASYIYKSLARDTNSFKGRQRGNLRAPFLGSSWQHLISSLPQPSFPFDDGIKDIVMQRTISETEKRTKRRRNGQSLPRASRASCRASAWGLQYFVRGRRPS